MRFYDMADMHAQCACHKALSVLLLILHFLRPSHPSNTPPWLLLKQLLLWGSLRGILILHTWCAGGPGTQTSGTGCSGRKQRMRLGSRCWRCSATPTRCGAGSRRSAAAACPSCTRCGLAAAVWRSAALVVFFLAICTARFLLPSLSVSCGASGPGHMSRHHQLLACEGVCIAKCMELIDARPGDGEMWQLLRHGQLCIGV